MRSRRGGQVSRTSKPVEVAAETTILPVGTLLWRIYSAGGAHPTTWDAFRAFGPTHARFDHHELPHMRGILYACQNLRTCLAEVFQATRVVDRTGGDPWVVGFRIERDIRLLDLTGAWPTRAGASMAISTGRRDRARRWSKAIYDAYPDVDGLFYGSSMYANKPCLVLYERAQSAMPSAPEFNRALADPALDKRLNAAAKALNYLLV